MPCPTYYGGSYKTSNDYVDDFVQIRQSTWSMHKAEKIFEDIMRKSAKCMNNKLAEINEGNYAVQREETSEKSE